jgi:hypothetical protein
MEAARGHHRGCAMPGPAPLYRPTFPAEFVDDARHLLRQRTISYHLHQRAQLVLLLDADPRLSNGEAAAAVHLHPNAVRYWRRRWASGRYVLDDAPGRGRKARFSPTGPRAGQSHCV